MDTIVYIDGFNLYYPLLKERPALKWLNLLQMVREVLPPTNNVIEIRYYTARVSGRLDPDAPRRQQLYLDALTTEPAIKTVFGSFLEKPKYASLYKTTLDRSLPDNQQTFRPWPDVAYVWKTEEKGSDVNLASHLLLDAFQNRYSVAAVVSNDSDLVEPIRIVTQVLGKPVGLLSPVKNPTPQLRAVSSFLLHIKTKHLAASQFPDPIVRPVGATVIPKPITWI